MRNFHNLISDMLELFYLEDVDVKIEREDSDAYAITITQDNFSVTYRAIVGRLPMVHVTEFRTTDEFLDDDNRFVTAFQSYLIDELYDGEEIE